MGRNLKMPWSIEDTIENMEQIRAMMIKRVRQVNLDGKGEEDVREINFDFCRVKEALEKQISMPERKAPSQFSLSPLLPRRYTDYEQGWNDCLDAMGGNPTN